MPLGQRKRRGNSQRTAWAAPGRKEHDAHEAYCVPRASVCLVPQAPPHDELRIGTNGSVPPPRGVGRDTGSGGLPGRGPGRGAGSGGRGGVAAGGLHRAEGARGRRLPWPGGPGWRAFEGSTRGVACWFHYVTEITKVGNFDVQLIRHAVNV